ncbi:MAG: alkene reductase [Gammaproteobacteria bacterium]|nr:alkene reductase [Gammaproteobacteria bacterium]
MNTTQPLLSQVRLGPYLLENRIVMAPMTRTRAANPERAPTALHVEYYAQRADAGLIVTEAAQVSPQGVGHVNTPGIHSAAQVAGWRHVTDAVHARGGRIFLQLWHAGRRSHPDFHDGALPVAPSAINPGSRVRTPEGVKDTVTPRALTTREVQSVIRDYVRAGENAILAGFDGVELHGANGYLIEEFLRDSSNRRGDRFGGSVANRSRFLFEIVEQLADAIGCERVGVRLSPANVSGIAADSDTTALYDFVVGVLDGYRLAYLHLIEAPEGNPALTECPLESVIARYRTIYQGTLVANNGYDRASGNAAIARGEADLIAYGKPFVANPGLVRRFKLDATLADANGERMSDGGAEGLVDYPPLDTHAA